MGCSNSMCSESDLIVTQELKKAETSKSTPLVSTDSSDFFSSLLTFSSKSLHLTAFHNLLLSDWIFQISRYLEENSFSSEDLKTSMSVSSDKSEMLLIHEIDFLKSFDMVKTFCERHFSGFDIKTFEKNEEFFYGLRSLSLNFYIRLGETVDCGIGIEKPLDFKQLNRFLDFTEEKESIFLWCGSLIPTAFYVSAIFPQKKVDFYIFDGHKAQNFLKGLSLFEFFGSPLEKGVKDQVMKFKNEAVTASIEISSAKIISLGLKMSSLTNVPNLLKELCIKDPNWPNTLNADSLHLELTCKGYSLNFVRSSVSSFDYLLYKNVR